MFAALREASTEVWDHRDLLEQLTLRDIKLRYKQAAMGFMWAVFMPCLIVLSGLIIRYAMARIAGQSRLRCGATHGHSRIAGMSQRIVETPMGGT